MIELLLVIQLSLSEKFSHAAIASSMIAHGADLSTSSWAFGKNPDKFKESNILLKPFSDDPIKLAVVKMGSATVINWILLKHHQKHPKLVTVIGIAQTIGIGFVAYRNSQIIK